MDRFVIEIDDPRRDDVRALLEQHLDFARGQSPPEDVHALDLEGLLDPTLTFFSLRVDGELYGIGAIKQLDANHAELKSMHTVKEARGQGVGRAMVDHLLDVAVARNVERVSLETGTMAAFAPARSLYASVGFSPCEPFADYFLSPNSIVHDAAARRPPAALAERAAGAGRHRRTSRTRDRIASMRLHHQPRSRSTRVLWLLEELGAPFDLTVIARETKQTPEYLALHPLGRSPVLEEEGGPVFESAALVLHLADQYPDAGLIAPPGSHERALQYQWCFFAMTEIEGALLDIARQLWKDAGEPTQRDRRQRDGTFRRSGRCDRTRARRW